MKLKEMKLRMFVLLIGIVAINSGCFTYKSFVPIDLKKIELNMPFAISDITIEDARTEISKEDDIKIPFMSGVKGKSWKHHPKLTQEHKNLIENTIYNNFNSNSTDTTNVLLTINYACKEFEQTGISEIERVYLSTELKLQTNSNEFYSSAIDTFHYESMDASNKHFENFFQTSLQNNIVRNISALRNQVYSSKQKEIECFSKDYFQTIELSNIVILDVSGKSEVKTIEIDGELKTSLTQEWHFKIVANADGTLTYIESLNPSKTKREELTAILKYLYNIKVQEFETNIVSPSICRKVTIRQHEQ